jgi:hypothetical protein
LKETELQLVHRDYMRSELFSQGKNEVCITRKAFIFIGLRGYAVPIRLRVRPGKPNGISDLQRARNSRQMRMGMMM